MKCCENNHNLYLFSLRTLLKYAESSSSYFYDRKTKIDPQNDENISDSPFYMSCGVGPGTMSSLVLSAGE